MGISAVLLGPMLHRENDMTKRFSAQVERPAFPQMERRGHLLQ
jgi:hypothetical protein